MPDNIHTTAAPSEATPEELKFLADAGAALREAIDKIRLMPKLPTKTSLTLNALMGVTIHFAQRYTDHSSGSFGTLASATWEMVKARGGGKTPVGQPRAEAYREPFRWRGEEYEVAIPHAVTLAALRQKGPVPDAVLGICTMAWGLYQKGARVYKDGDEARMLNDPNLAPEVVEMAEAAWKLMEPLTKPAPRIIISPSLASVTPGSKE